MKKILLSLLIAGNLALASCNNNEGMNEDPTGNERGTPGIGTEEPGTGPEPDRRSETGYDTLPGNTPMDTSGSSATTSGNTNKNSPAPLNNSQQKKQ